MKKEEEENMNMIAGNKIILELLKDDTQHIVVGLHPNSKLSSSTRQSLLVCFKQL